MMFESVRAFFRSMQEDGYVIEIRSFEQVRGTNPDRVGFTIRGMCVRDPSITENTQPLMIGFDD
jgi:hypothetical protein